MAVFSCKVQLMMRSNLHSTLPLVVLPFTVLGSIEHRGGRHRRGWNTHNTHSKNHGSNHCHDMT